MNNSMIVIQPQQLDVLEDLTRRGISYLLVGEFALYPYLIQNSVPTLQLWVDTHTGQFQRFIKEGSTSYMDAVYQSEDIDKIDIRIHNTLTRLHRHVPGFTTDDFPAAFSRQQSLWAVTGPGQEGRKVATLGFSDLVEHILQFPRSPLTDRLKQEFRDYLQTHEEGKTYDGKRFLQFTPHQPHHLLSARERINHSVSPATLLMSKGYTSLPEFDNETTAFRVYSRLHKDDPGMALTGEDSAYILYRRENNPAGETALPGRSAYGYINLRYVQDQGDTYDLLRQLESDRRMQDVWTAKLLSEPTRPDERMPVNPLPDYYNRNSAVLRTMIWNKHYSFKAAKHAVSAENYPIFWGRVQVAKNVPGHTVYFPQTNAEDTIVAQINGQEAFTTPLDTPDALWSSNPPVTLARTLPDQHLRPVPAETEGYLFTFQGRKIFVTADNEKPGQLRQVSVGDEDYKNQRVQRFVIFNHPQQALYFHEIAAIRDKDGTAERRMYIAIPEDPTPQQKARLEALWEKNKGAEIVLAVENRPDSERMALNVLTFAHPGYTGHIHTRLYLEEPQEGDASVRQLVIETREPLPAKALQQLADSQPLDYASRADRIFDGIKLKAGLIPSYQRDQEAIVQAGDEPRQGITRYDVLIPAEQPVISHVFYEATRERNWQAELSIFQYKRPAFGDETFRQTFEKKNRASQSGSSVRSVSPESAPAPRTTRSGTPAPASSVGVQLSLYPAPDPVENTGTAGRSVRKTGR